MYPQYATQNLITVSGFIARNPDVDTSVWDSTTTSGFISRATKAMQNYCNVDGFLTTNVTAERAKSVMTVEGDLIIFPRIRPLNSVSAVRLVKGGFSTNLTLSGSGQQYFQIPYPYTSLSYPSTYLAGTGTLMMGGTNQMISLRASNTYYEIDYNGGFASVPEDLADAADLWVRDLLTRRLNPMGAQLIKQGSVMIQHSLRNDSVDSIYISQAKALLNQGGYVRVAQGE